MLPHTKGSLVFSPSEFRGLCCFVLVVSVRYVGFHMRRPGLLTPAEVKSLLIKAIGKRATTGPFAGGETAISVKNRPTPSTLVFLRNETNEAHQYGDKEVEHVS